MELIKDLGMLYATAKSKYKTRYGMYVCPICSIPFKCAIADVKRKHTGKCRSCARTTHGLRGHPLYTLWSKVRYRCNNVNSRDYPSYGGRGITLSKEFHDGNTFFEYIERLDNFGKDGYTLDRIDVDGNYERGNLRWASKTVQSQNTRLLRSTNTSGFRGVTLHGTNWRAQITVARKHMVIGSYPTKEDAARAYDKYVIDNGTEHPLNFPEDVK